MLRICWLAATISHNTEVVIILYRYISVELSFRYSYVKIKATLLQPYSNPCSPVIQQDELPHSPTRISTKACSPSLLLIFYLTHPPQVFNFLHFCPFTFPSYASKDFVDNLPFTLEGKIKILAN